MIELDHKAYDKALAILEQAIAKIEALQELDDETFTFEQGRSLNGLGEMAAQIRKNRPLSDIERLEQQLQRAVNRQEFERAAQLRDRIRALRNSVSVETEPPRLLRRSSRPRNPRREREAPLSSGGLRRCSMPWAVGRPTRLTRAKLAEPSPLQPQRGLCSNAQGWTEGTTLGFATQPRCG